MTPEDQLIEDIGKYAADPLGYTRYAFPWADAGELKDSKGPRVWQAEVLDGIGGHLRSKNRCEPLQLAVSSGHGIGKSALIAMIANWAMSTCDDCRIVVTANTEAQLATKTWPEICKWFRLAINAHWWNVGATTVSVKEKAHERSWRIDRIPWSENNTEAFAGLHNKGKRIVVIYDEASAIADRIWEVTEGALTDEDTEIIWIAFGNPTKNTGRFRECFGRYSHRWFRKQIDSRTVEGTNKVQLDKWVEDYGEDSDFCRVRVRGEFPRAGSAQFISGELVAEARTRKVGDQSKAWKILSVDVARFGDDQSVLGTRQGLRARILAKYRGLDTMEIGARVVEAVKAENPRACVIDGDGVGGGVVDYARLNLADYMKEHPAFRLEEFHGAATPADPFMYFNRRAEVWGLMRDWLATGEIPDDAELDTDLTGPEYFHSPKGQIQLERKDDMKDRGLASPDAGDMLAMTFSPTPTPKTREEALAEQLAVLDKTDPMEAHFVRLRETDRRQQPKQQRNYWD